MLLLLATAALAADPAPFPLAAPVDLPVAGTARIRVPPELRSLDDPPDGSDLLLVDGTGRAVPVAVVRGEPEAESRHVRTVATPDPQTWELQPAERPIDGLRIDLGMGEWAATATVQRLEDGAWVPHAEGFLWRTSTDEARDLPFATTADRLRVQLLVHYGRGNRFTRFSGLHFTEPRAPADTLVVPVTDWRLTEDHVARYAVDLPHPTPAGQLTVRAEEDVFARSAQVTLDPLERHALLRAGPPELERVRLGGATIDRTTLPAPAAPQGALLLNLLADGLPPLTIPEVALTLEGVHLLAQDPGPGPHTLYAGAPPGTAPAWDLQVAVAELARLAPVAVDPGPVGENPHWEPPELRTSLGLPGPALAFDDFRWRHPVEAEPGLTLIPLEDEILASARPDLGDLRLLTEQGAQVPFLHHTRPVDRSWGELPFERTERGQTSILTVPLPEANLPVSTVTLRTEATAFRRTVTVARPRGAELETLRVFRWQGTERPGRVTLEVGQRVGEVLVITIDNGSNAPLPITSVEVARPARDLLVHLPPEPVWLVYGQPRLALPDYDLALLDRELRTRTAATASLGPRKAIAPTPLSLWAQLMLFAGVGVLVLGLAALTVSLLRAVPEPDTEPDTEADSA